MTAHFLSASNEQHESKMPSGEREKNKETLLAGNRRQERTCANMRRGGKSLHHFLFHTSRWLASNISPLYTVSFTPLLYRLCLFFLYHYYEYRSVRAVRDQRWGLHLFSLRFLLVYWILIYALSPSFMIVDLSVYTVLIMCFFWLTDWVRFCVLIALDIFHDLLPSISFCWLPSLSMDSLFLITRASTTKKFIVLIRLVSPVLYVFSQVVGHAM
jgi:hypothetical protein